MICGRCLLFHCQSIYMLICDVTTFCVCDEAGSRWIHQFIHLTHLSELKFIQSNDRYFHLIHMKSKWFTTTLTMYSNKLIRNWCDALRHTRLFVKSWTKKINFKFIQQIRNVLQKSIHPILYCLTVNPSKTKSIKWCSVYFDLKSFFIAISNGRVFFSLFENLFQ